MYKFKRQKAKKKMLKYLFKVLKGLHQWLNFCGLKKEFFKCNHSLLPHLGMFLALCISEKHEFLQESH